jgi:hypothetical protein
VRAEEDRRALGGRLDPREDVPDGRPDRRACIVLVGLQTEVAQIRRDDVGDTAFFPGRARDRRQLGEEVEHLRSHVRDLRRPHQLGGGG